MKVNYKKRKGEKDNMKWEYDKKVDTLIERIKWADAILVGVYRRFQRFLLPVSVF